MCMFKKICVLLFLLLVVFLSVSSVTANNEQQYNETEVEYTTNTDKNSIDISVDDKLSDNTDEKVVVDTNITLSLQQGEHIEMVFNRSNLKSYPHCYINDDDISSDWDFSDEEMYVYVPISAIGDDAVNLGVNTLTVKYHGYPYIIEKVDSNLIHFKTMDLNETEYYKDYFYNFNLNISKKQEKTIHITNNITYYYHNNIYVYYKLRDIDKFSFNNETQLILNKNGKIYYNDLISSYHEKSNYYSVNVDDILFFDNITIPTGFYNLTLVNYDGTNDTCLCEFKKEQWNITFEYNIINDTVLFQFDTGTFIDYDFYSDYNMTIKVGNITKSIPSKKFDMWKVNEDPTVLFDNLGDGFYDVVIEIPGNEWIEDFLYTTKIEIGNSSGVPDDNDDIIGNDNVTNDTIISLNNITGDSNGNSSLLSQGNSSGANSSYVSGNDGQNHIKKSSDVDFNNEHVSGYGDLELTGSIHSADSAKSYEISKNQKNEDKGTNNEYYVALMFFIFFMVGFFRFKRVYY